MQDWLTGIYPWLKALHIMAVIAWMAGLFYLPRIFVYHAEKATPGSELSETFKVMEMKLYRFIMNPSMIATWLFGILMLVALGLDYLSTAYWFHAKALLIVLMTWFHHWLGLRRKDFLADANSRTGRTYRLMNEVPTLAMIGIVILVVVQPF